MQILLADKKKNIIFVAITIIGLGGIIYFNFFYNRAETTPTSTTDAGDSTAGGSGHISQTLPYGPKLNLKILDQDLFRRLRPFTPVRVLPEELGQSNPF